MTAVGLGGIQDKTRWTKALGKAVLVVYGIITTVWTQPNIAAAAAHEETEQYLRKRLAAIG